MAANARSSKINGSAATISFDDQNDWGAGFVGNVSITNTSGRALTGWTIEFDLAQSITNLWNAVVVSHVGAHYVIRNAAWNGTVAAGGTVSFGFQAGGGNPVLPTRVTWNGATQGGTVSPPPAPLPTVSATAASVTETGAAAAALTFQLSLSAASAQPVTVAWTTQDGTARAGRDYDAGSGTVTFAPGATTASVTVTTHPGALSTGAFTLHLSNPSGATLASPDVTGIIINPAPPPPPPTPKISVQDIVVHEAPVSSTPSTPTPTPAAGSGALLPTGFLHTSGNQILDSSGHAVRIAAVNWFGMETSNFAPHGLWTQSYHTMMRQMVTLGFNAIRLPFSLQLFDPASKPNGIDFNKNPDLAGLNGLQIMDKIVSYASQLGLKIILDNHRSAAGGGPNGNGLWYDDGYTEKNWVDTWTMLARHYAGNSTVIGGDLLNEPHGAATWGDGGPNDWAAAATRAGNAVLAANPDWLIMVEGTETVNGNSTWWGGNLQGVATHPVVLSSPGHVVYSPHDYPASVYPQRWFSDPAYPANLPAVWTANWGYIAQQGIAPIWVGEFGTTDITTSDQQWLQALVQYMNTTGTAAGGQGISWAYWSWNPDSGDTGGILKDDWTTVNTDKVAAIQPAEYHPGTTAVTPPPTPALIPDGTAIFTVALSAASTQPVTVHYATVDGTAHAGTDYAPITGDLVFAPGETSKTVGTQLYATPGQTGQMQFLLALSNPQNGTLATPTATASLIHDPAGPVTPPTPPPSTGATVQFAAVNSWQGGYQEAVNIQAGSNPLQGWTVELRTNDTIGNLWNGIILSHTAGVYTIGAASWNGAVNANGTTSFGFVATGGGDVTGRLV